MWASVVCYCSFAVRLLASLFLSFFFARRFLFHALFSFLFSSAFTYATWSSSVIHEARAQYTLHKITPTSSIFPCSFFNVKTFVLISQNMHKNNTKVNTFFDHLIFDCSVLQNTVFFASILIQLYFWNGSVCFVVISVFLFSFFSSFFFVSSRWFFFILMFWVCLVVTLKSA